MPSARAERVPGRAVRSPPSLPRPRRAKHKRQHAAAHERNPSASQTPHTTRPDRCRRNPPAPPPASSYSDPASLSPAARIAGGDRSAASNRRRRPDAPRNGKGVGARVGLVAPEKRGHARGMAQEMEKLGGTSEEEDDEEMEMEVKEEEDEEEEEEERGSGSREAAVMGMVAQPAGEDMGGRYFQQPGRIDGGGGRG
uniref:Cyclin-dependent kinase 11A n=1 Tax=Elaeis guineensis var. tenera TaxID=51953 RepID=A0A6J0PC26_ELAGV|nr:cyclin-dependent kinase 11A [Elaeis guineensis]